MRRWRPPSRVRTTDGLGRGAFSDATPCYVCRRSRYARSAIPPAVYEGSCETRSQGHGVACDPGREVRHATCRQPGKRAPVAPAGSSQGIWTDRKKDSKLKFQGLQYPAGPGLASIFYLESVILNRFFHGLSRQHRADDVPMHVGQPAVDAVVAERQSRVVDAQQVQDRRVQVVAVGLAGGGLPRPGVALAVGDAALDARSRQPRRRRCRRCDRGRWRPG